MGNKGAKNKISAAEQWHKDQEKRKKEEEADKKRAKNKFSRRNTTMGSSIRKLIMSSDYFYQEVKFNFKGKEKLTTGLGAFLSLCIRVSVLAFFVMTVMGIVSQNSFNVNEGFKELVFDPENPDPISIQDYEYDMVFGFDQYMPPEIGWFSAQLETYDDGLIVALEELEVAQCYEHESAAHLKADNIFPNINGFCILDLFDADLVGNANSRLFKQLSIYLNKCKDRSRLKCDSNTEIENWLNERKFQIASKKTYPITQEITGSPVFFTYEPILNQQFSTSIYQKTTLFLQKARYEFYDLILAKVISLTKEGGFLNMDRVIHDTETRSDTNEGKYLGIHVQLSGTQTLYQRQVGSLWNVLALAGGLAVALISICKGMLFVCRINSKYSITQMLIKSQFQTRTRYLNLTKDEKEKEIEQSTKGTQINVKKSDKNSLSNSGHDGESQDSTGSIKARLADEIKEQNLEGILNEICTRERFNAGIRSFKKRFCTCYDEEREDMIKKIRANGILKLERSMDIHNILKKMRNFEVLYNYIFDSRMKYLVKFNTRHVIDSDSDFGSMISGDSLFSANSEKEKGTDLRQRVSLRLLEASTLVDNCVIQDINRDLINGVGNMKRLASSMISEIESKQEGSQRSDRPVANAHNQHLEEINNKYHNKNRPNSAQSKSISMSSVTFSQNDKSRNDYVDSSELDESNASVNTTQKPIRPQV